ncbi:MAG: hypothetical protein KAI50_13760 [Desulfobacterales bacterium]|nr:hypothetical protein [Desulfobacterales bacterium]
MTFFILFFIFNLVFVFPAFPEIETCSDQLIVIANEIPYGKKGGGLAAKGSSVTALFQVESRTEKDLTINYEIRIPKPLMPQGIPDDMQVEDLKSAYLLTTTFSLTTEFDRWYRTLEIELPENIPEAVYEILSVAKIPDASGRICKEFNLDRLEVVNKKRFSQYFAIKEVIIPVDDMGEPQKKEKKNSVLMKTKDSVLTSFLLQKKEDMDNFEPSAYAAVVIENRTASDASVLVTLKILDPETKAEMRGFEPLLPPGHGGLSLKGIYRLVKIKPESCEKVVLPIYAEEGVALAGRYLAQFELRHFGTNTVLSGKEIPIDVLTRRIIPVLTTIFALAGSVCTLFWLYWKRKKFLNIKTKDLITIALFGTCMFAAVSLPGTIVWRFAHGVLGPFSFLITGFFYEIVHYILLTALVVLIPRVGVVALAIILKALMTDIVFGGFSPMSLLNVGVTVIMSEGAFYLCGITRNPAAPDRKKIALAAICCGLADVVISFVSFNMIMFLYRLYYEFWYIVMYLLISGFLYTVLAVPFGIRLGMRLKAVH